MQLPAIFSMTAAGVGLGVGLGEGFGVGRGVGNGVGLGVGPGDGSGVGADVGKAVKRRYIQTRESQRCALVKNDDGRHRKYMELVTYV